MVFLDDLIHFPQIFLFDTLKNLLKTEVVFGLLGSTLNRNNVLVRPNHMTVCLGLRRFACRQISFNIRENYWEVFLRLLLRLRLW